MASIVVIPALNPQPALVDYVEEVLRSGVAQVVVVNDGSPADYAPIFRSLTAQPAVTVLHHTVNQGKGQALKTAYRYILDSPWRYEGVITVDADGQHSCADIARLAALLPVMQCQILLGTRDFSLPQVPPRSRIGNRLTSLLFFLLYGVWLPDTQTGLRAIPAALLPLQLAVEGERFDYEMWVLIRMKQQGIDFKRVPVATLYAENHSSHYRTLQDSWRIAKVLAGGKFRRPAAVGYGQELWDH